MKTKPIITTPSTVPTTPASLRPPKADAFIGIDFHKRYSGYHVFDPDGLDLAKGRIKVDEAALAERMRQTPALSYVQSLPGMGPILAAVVVNEVDDIAHFASAQKFSGYAGLCPSTSSSGGKTYQGKLLKHCNKWLRRAFDSLRSLSGQPLVV